MIDLHSAADRDVLSCGIAITRAGAGAGARRSFHGAIAEIDVGLGGLIRADALVVVLRVGVGVGAELPALRDELVHHAWVGEDEHDAEIGDTEPDAAAERGDVHVGRLSGLVVDEHAVAVARCDEEEMDIGFLERRVARGVRDRAL